MVGLSPDRIHNVLYNTITEVSMSFEIKGLEKIQRDLAEVQSALASLDGEIAKLRFNSANPASVEQAIREMEQAVDIRTAAYSGNPMVAKLAQVTKDAFRNRLLEAKHEKT